MIFAQRFFLTLCRYYLNGASRGPGQNNRYSLKTNDLYWSIFIEYNEHKKSMYFLNRFDGCQHCKQLAGCVHFIKVGKLYFKLAIRNQHRYHELKILRIVILLVVVKIY